MGSEPYDAQGFAQHKHQIAVGDHFRVLDQVPGDRDQEHSVHLNQGLGGNEDHNDCRWPLGGWERTKVVSEERVMTACAKTCGESCEIPPTTSNRQIVLSCDVFGS